MIALPTHPGSLDTVLAAGGHGGNAWAWIAGWLIVLAVIIGLVVYFYRRRRGPHDQPHDRAGQPR
jgi:hypothetical protein